MLQVEQLMLNAEWFDKSPNGPADVGDLSPLTPSLVQSGKDWSALVQHRRQELVDERCKNIPGNINNFNKADQYHLSEVKIIDKAYLTAKFKAKVEKDQGFINNTVSDFSLNAEQERPFHIIANHASSNKPEQLKMYLGGIAGTGKSQVIKALITFFQACNESHCIIVMAPTGNAAALVGGSTCHSVLGINDKISSNISMAKVRTRLEGVDYVFLDEISMLSCHDLYKICTQLTKASNEPNKPFGGINIVLLVTLPSYLLLVEVKAFPCTVEILYSGLNHYGQESAIGKAFWHQVTTVVILRENMRQKFQTLEDAQF